MMVLVCFAASGTGCLESVHGTMASDYHGICKAQCSTQRHNAAYPSTVMGSSSMTLTQNPNQNAHRNRSKQHVFLRVLTFSAMTTCVGTDR